MRESKEMALGRKALELIMRDVLDGLEELALQANYDARPGQFEIIAIEPPEATGQARSKAPSRKRPSTRSRSGRDTADVVSFIEERERIAMRAVLARRKAAC